LDLSFGCCYAYGITKCNFKLESKSQCAHTLKTKERAHIVSMCWVGMRSKDKNKEEMRHTVQGIWDQVSLEQLQMLISSMPNRMQQIISTKGGSTRW
jgi:hypothetical protein